jgi:predicted amidohydrolase YtcJ
MLAEDPHDVEADLIKTIRVVRTVVGGKTVYEA